MNYTKYIKTSNLVSQAQSLFESIQSGTILAFFFFLNQKQQHWAFV